MECPNLKVVVQDIAHDNKDALVYVIEAVRAANIIQRSQLVAMP